LKTYVGYTAVKLELPAGSKSKVNSGFVAGQLLSGSLVSIARVDCYTALD
jgi:hypothetical protein